MANLLARMIAKLGFAAPALRTQAQAAVTDDSVDVTPLLKALSLEQAYAKNDLWPLHDALRASVESIFADEQLAPDQRQAALQQTIGEYSTRVLTHAAAPTIDHSEYAAYDAGLPLQEGTDPASMGEYDYGKGTRVDPPQPSLTDPTAPTVPLALTQVCPGCGAAIPVQAVTCPICGTDVSIIDDVPLRETTKATPAVKPGATTCPACKATIPAGATKCPECGTVMKAADGSSSSTKESQMDLTKQAEILKGLPEQVTKMVADLEVEKTANQVVMKAQADRIAKLEADAEAKERLARATTLTKGTTMEPAVVAELLKGDDATVKATEALVKALADAQEKAGIFKALGGDVVSDTDPTSVLLAKAAELRKTDPKLSDAQAFRAAADANPDLYAASLQA